MPCDAEATVQLGYLTEGESEPPAWLSDGRCVQHAMVTVEGIALRERRPMAFRSIRKGEVIDGEPA